MEWTDTIKEFERLDKEATPLNGAQKDIFSSLLRGSGWEQGDGPIMGVWWPDKRPPGHRCLWSVCWTLRKVGLITPSQYLPVEAMRHGELLHEAMDVAFRSHDSKSFPVVQLVLQYWERSIVNPAGWINNMRRGLFEARGIYPEFTASWSLPPRGDKNVPGRLMRQVDRPGWPVGEPEFLRG